MQHGCPCPLNVPPVLPTAAWGAQDRRHGMQVMTLACGTSEGMYQLLPGREAYQQQEPFLLAGLSTLLAACDPPAMHALVRRHPDMRSLVIQRVSAICRPAYNPDSACNALQSLVLLLQVRSG